MTKDFPQPAPPCAIISGGTGWVTDDETDDFFLNFVHMKSLCLPPAFGLNRVFLFLLKDNQDCPTLFA